MDGRHPHWVEEYTGTRYSLVLFWCAGAARPLFWHSRQQPVWKAMLNESSREQQRLRGPLLVGHDCAGIDAPGWALRNLGVVFESSWIAEIHPKCEKVLRAHSGSGILLAGEKDGDVTKRAHDKLPPCDVYFAGFPCQGISRMGQRRGFEDSRT